jgi:tetratricopeptide (TPR) repeat protein
LDRKGHPSELDLRRFTSGALGGEEARRIVGHLLHRCETCAAKLRRAGFPTSDGVPQGPPVAEEDYEPAISLALDGIRLHGTSVLAKKREARRIQEQLAAGRWQPGSRKSLRGRPRYSFYEALLQRAWEVRFTDLGEMVSLTWFACFVASRLGRDGYTEVQVSDFMSRAYCEHCNAKRAAHRLSDAEAIFVRAVQCWKAGTKDFRLWVRLMDVRASLLGDQQCTYEAIDVLADVFEAYLQLGDRHSAGRALVTRGIYVGHGGDPEAAVQLLDEALELLDEWREPELLSMANHNRLWFLVDCGRYREARSELWKHRHRVTDSGSLGRISMAKIAYLEGRINAGLGELKRAERALQSALDRLSAAEVEALRGLVSLDLAVVWMRQGRFAEASTLAAEATAALQKLGLPREAQKALRVLQDEIEDRVATVAVVQAVVDFLRRIEHAPQARFSLSRNH